MQAEDIIDSDTLDENDNPYVDRTRNLGGKSGDSEEEAYLETTLAGGARYVIVVGAGTETGTYELRVKEIDDPGDGPEKSESKGERRRSVALFFATFACVYLVYGFQWTGGDPCLSRMRPGQPVLPSR